jgi:hypothetical protein
VNDDAFTGDKPPPSGRGNGLPASAWVSVCDVDPRLAAPLLDALRDASVAAYVAPSTGSVGHYLEIRLPAGPADRLWVDAARRAEAEQIVSTALPELRASLEDERWAELVASLSADDAGTDAGSDEKPWPEIEGSASATTTADDAPAYDIVSPAADEEDHFVPPDPPLVPLDNPITRYGWIALLGGCLLLLIPALIGRELGSGWLLVAMAGIIGGFITLVMRMKDSPPTDSGPDDGAVV